MQVDDDDNVDVKIKAWAAECANQCIIIIIIVVAMMQVDWHILLGRTLPGDVEPAQLREQRRPGRGRDQRDLP